MLPALVAISTLSELRLSGNRYSGRIPDAWGASGAFPNLQNLLLDDNSLSGPLPAAWGGRDRLPKLANLALHGNALEGTIPDSWVSAGAFATFIDNADTYPTLFPSEFDSTIVFPRGVM